jgi:hypothetical protein
MLPNPDVGNQREMVGRNQRKAGPWKLDAQDLDVTRVIDVVEVQDRKQSRIGSPPA